ncbi:hypothetical protein IscW_ISCW016203 [Ixodes scapularis]|uniref:GH18 domain-containing protein n=1 Tax=Ixodes scapularis TaxID=6945 RepID=B7P0S9_IXOSC|nr:hypothetical protein IscW_ISCW016203 [Ixodes scapularis]|eukprot:XP_002399305.1 hypothetical protein IscW_ISCW016203 [Ixodes scapularis]
MKFVRRLSLGRPEPYVPPVAFLGPRHPDAGAPSAQLLALGSDPRALLRQQMPAEGLRASKSALIKGLPGNRKSDRSTGESYQFADRPAASSRVWYYVWTVTSVGFICIVIPLGVFLLPQSPTLARRRRPREKDTQTVAPDNADEDLQWMNLSEQQLCTQRFAADHSPAPRLAAADDLDFLHNEANTQFRELFCIFTSQDGAQQRIEGGGGVQTVAPDNADEDLQWMNLSEQQLCTQRFAADHSPAPRLAAADDLDFLHNEANTQFRELFCIFTSQYSRRRQPYHPKYLPLSFCTAVVVHALTVLRTTAEQKRPVMDGAYLDTLRSLRREGRLLHRRSPVAVYLGVGGDWRDSARFSLATRDRAFLTRLAHDLVGLVRRDSFQGLYVDWDHPKGRCGHDGDTQQLRTFVEAIRGQVDGGLLLAVSPVHAGDYGLEMAARALAQLRAEHPEYWSKFIYSVSVAPYTYRTDSSPQLGATSKNHSVFDWPVRQKGRTSYDQVCKLDVVQQTTDRECAVAYQGSRRSGDFKVAAFAGPQQLWRRMAMSYDDGMGDTPVVVYDLDLDDFLNKCTPSVMSPLVEAIAVGVV